MTNEQYACPCCGYMTLDERPPGTFDICSVCFWEDDRQQFEDPDLAGGANRVSLREARENFKRFGAREERFRHEVRSPLPHEIPKP